MLVTEKKVSSAYRNRTVIICLSYENYAVTVFIRNELIDYIV